jgi:hypothetical protein
VVVDVGFSFSCGCFVLFCDPRTTHKIRLPRYLYSYCIFLFLLACVWLLVLAIVQIERATSTKTVSQCKYALLRARRASRCQKSYRFRIWNLELHILIEVVHFTKNRKPNGWIEWPAGRRVAARRKFSSGDEMTAVVLLFVSAVGRSNPSRLPVPVDSLASRESEV